MEAEYIVVNYLKEGQLLKKILLINPNFMKPPVAPIAIDCLGSALLAAGFPVAFLDLSFEDDFESALRKALTDEPLYVGVTIRNVDDSFFATRDFCLEKVRPIIEHLKKLTDAPIIVGGIGYSIFPLAALEYLGANLGICGDGEIPAVALAQAISRYSSWLNIPGLIGKEKHNFFMNPPAPADLAAIDLTDRALVDNERYLREGGMVGFETKRGCTASCSYCADPIAKGTICRLRAPAHVVQELALLEKRGISYFHTCDSEFNIPRSHAYEVCRAIIQTGLGEKICWYAYMNPAYFDRELAHLMRQAGCAGINFGADHSNPGMLKSLGRIHTAATLRETAKICRSEGINCMFDLLFGAPGETPETVRESIDFMKQTEASCIGIGLGVRLYPNAPLAQQLLASASPDANGFYGLESADPNLLRPVYYVSPFLGKNPYRLLSDLVKDDERFFLASPEHEESNYNYNDNSLLSEAIRSGERGAFWDILRRSRLRGN